jgi:amino acid permease
MSVYFVVAGGGYWTFGDAVASDVLAAYPPSSAIVATARVAIALVVTFSYPLQSHPARACLTTLLGAPRRGGWITAAFLLLSTSIALSLDDLGIVLSVVGATGSTTVSYILPGGCYYLLFRDHAPGSLKPALALAQCVVGLLLVPMLLTLIYLKETSGRELI